MLDTVSNTFGKRWWHLFDWYAAPSVSGNANPVLAIGKHIIRYYLLQIGLSVTKPATPLGNVMCRG